MHSVLDIGSQPEGEGLRGEGEDMVQKVARDRGQGGASWHGQQRRRLPLLPRSSQQELAGRGFEGGWEVGVGGR